MFHGHMQLVSPLVVWAGATAAGASCKLLRAAWHGHAGRLELLRALQSPRIVCIEPRRFMARTNAHDRQSVFILCEKQMQSD
jgi:hypothetical protein